MGSAPASTKELTMSRKLAHASALYLEGILEGRPAEAVAAYTGDRYTQHSTGVRDGQEGFIEFFSGFLERNPVRDIRIVRGWEDGPHVFLHVYQSLNHGEFEYVTTDFFDTDSDDRIVEHWDVISLCKGPGVSGRTPIDGPTEITDLEKTEENKALVRALIETLLMRGGQPERVGEFVAEDHRQHSPEVPDGLAAFRALLTAPDRSLYYDRIVLLVGKGNFVATLCEAHRGDEAYAQVDIFRVEGGKVVEHWDNVEPVPAEDVNSGKF